jgi:hypothetical protein
MIIAIGDSDLRSTHFLNALLQRGGRLACRSGRLPRGRASIREVEEVRVLELVREENAVNWYCECRPDHI